MKSPGILARALIVTGGLAGCAVATTPQQDLAYARWAKCSSGYVHLMDVTQDGRITVQITNASERDAILICLAEAGRGGPALPAPAFVRPPGGP